jgi:hypothetical protein
LLLLTCISKMVVLFMANQPEQLEWLAALFEHHVQRLGKQPSLEEQQKLLRGMEILRESIDRIILSALETDTSSSPAPNESSAQLQADT